MCMNNLEFCAHISLLCVCVTEAVNRAYAQQGAFLPEWFL
jgi:hypothetical protein